jgi:hypothetical protein
VEVSRSRSASDVVSGEQGLSLIVPEETVWHTATDVSRTLLSPAYGAFQPAPLVRCHARVLLPTETATALLPGGGAIRQECEALIAPHIEQKLEPRLASMAQAAVQVYELDYHDESQGFFFALGDEAWSFGPWSSDARVLYCHIEKETLAHLIVIGGTYVAWQGQPLLKATRASDVFEWRKQDALMNAMPGELSATALFEKLTGSSASPSAGVDHSSSNQGSSDQGSSTYAEKH